jgi:LacI family transcriptional regulator
MHATTPPFRTGSCRILLDLALNFGYGRQMALGVKRFRAKRPDWLLQMRVLSTFSEVASHKQLFQGAIGHFYESSHQNIIETLDVPFYVSVSNRKIVHWCPRVISDDVAVGRMAADYFLARGHRNFAYLEEPWNYFAGERAAGFCERILNAGIDEPAAWGLDDFDVGMINPDRLPMALFAMTDHAALRIISKLLDAGYRIPEDIALLGVDNDDLVNLISPVELSSIRLASEPIGFAACECLEHMMQRGKLETGVRRFAPLEVIERRSTGGRPVTDPRVRRAQAFIEDHLQSMGGVDEVAVGVGVSRRSLDRLFAEHLQTSPADWVALRRAERAEILLRETDYTVEHIAELAGFEDRRRLYRAFKKLDRPLPREIRKRDSNFTSPAHRQNRTH